MSDSTPPAAPAGTDVAGRGGPPFPAFPSGPSTDQTAASTPAGGDRAAHSPADVRQSTDAATEPTRPAPTEPGAAEPGPPEPAPSPAAGESSGSGPVDDAPASVAVPASYLDSLDQHLATLGEQLGKLSGRTDELARLRTRDADLVDRLHADNSKLRAGEISTALQPMVNGLVRLHDLMVNLAGDDPSSDAGLLRSQLLQLLDTVTGITSFEPEPGTVFDTKLHSGAGRAVTADAEQDGTVARTVRAGFVRQDGTVIRAAEVEVFRFQEPEPAPAPAPDLAPVSAPDPATVSAPDPASGSASGSAETVLGEQPSNQPNSGTGPGTSSPVPSSGSSVNSTSSENRNGTDTEAAEAAPRQETS